MQTYDLTVVGAGPAGVAAAVTAARMGARVLLLEKDAALGGMSTCGLINIFCGNAICGFFSEVKRAVVREDDAGRMIYDPETLLALYMDMVAESRVSVLLDARATSAAVEDGRVKAIEVATRAGTRTVASPLYIDASGDGQLAFLAGAPYTLGRESDGAMQPMSMMAVLSGVENARHLTFGDARALSEKLARRAAEMGIVGGIGHIIVIPCLQKGMVTLNMTNCVGADGSDPESFTRAQFVCRAQIAPIVGFLRENLPGYENCELLRTAAYAGARETRHFEGRKRLEVEDVRAGRVFDDWCVSRASNGVNIHNTAGSGKDATSESAPGDYTIPYGALLPRALDNLLLAGRCISGSHLAHGSYRVIPICMATGEAAGTAAALCAKEKCYPHALDPRRLQRELIARGSPEP